MTWRNGDSTLDKASASCTYIEDDSSVWVTESTTVGSVVVVMERRVRGVVWGLDRIVRALLRIVGTVEKALVTNVDVVEDVMATVKAARRTMAILIVLFRALFLCCRCWLVWMVVVVVVVVAGWSLSSFTTQQRDNNSHTHLSIFCIPTWCVRQCRLTVHHVPSRLNGTNQRKSCGTDNRQLVGESL